MGDETSKRRFTDHVDPGEDPLIAEMVALRAKLAVSRRRELLFRAFVLLVLLGFALGGASLHATIQQQQVDRAAARLAACQQENKLRSKVRQSFADSVNVVIPANPTPEQKVRIDEFLSAYTGAVNHRLADRDCSPAGLSRYYQPTPTTVVGH